MLTPGINESSILGYAVALAEDHQSALIVVEVLTEAPTDVEQGVSSPDELEEQMTENRRRRLEALDTCLADLRESVANELLPALSPVCHLVKGSHRDEITRTPDIWGQRELTRILGHSTTSLSAFTGEQYALEGV